jgi:hypothetical protein
MAVFAACPVFASGINLIYSWELEAPAAFATCKATRRGELLTYIDNPSVFTATLFNRAKEKGSVLIDHSLVLPGALDTTFFAVRGTMKQLVYSVLTLTGATYQLYDVKPGPITTAVGAFAIPALLSFGVSYFSNGAGSLDVIAVNGSNVTVRVRTYNRKFAPVLDQQVEAHLQYTGAQVQAAALGVIVSNIVMFQDDGNYLRVLNGTDPVNGIPRFNFYKIGHTKLLPVTAPSLLARLLGDGIGPFVYPVCKDGLFYVYDKTKLQTVAGPFAIPGTSSNDVFGTSWIFAKPVQRSWLAQWFPGLNNITPAADLITLGVSSTDGYSLRSYRVTAAGARARQRSTSMAGMVSCALYGKSFMLVQTNGTGSTVHKIASGNLKEQAAQACASATPIISADRYFTDDSVTGIHHKVTAFAF